MTTVVTAKHSRLQVLTIMTALTIFGIFIMLLLREPVSYQEGVEKEITYVRDSVSAFEWEKLDDTTRRRFSEYLYESGAFEKIKEWLIPKASDSEFNKTFTGKWNQQFVQNVQVFVYQSIHRLGLMEFWLLNLAPLMICLVIAGYNRHRVNLYGIGGASANSVRLYLKVLWFAGVGVLLYTITPNVVGEYALYTPAFMLLVLALAAKGIIESFHKG